jgi:hypothetical protein
MLTNEQVNELAELASAIANINKREQKTLANTVQRYAIERGKAKAGASDAVRALHGIDLAKDPDVRAWRETLPDAEDSDEDEPRGKGGR